MSFIVPSFNVVWAPGWIWCDALGNLLMATFIGISAVQVLMALRVGKHRRVVFTYSTRGMALLCVTLLGVALNQALYVVAVVYPIIPLLASWNLFVGILFVAAHLKLQLTTIPVGGLESVCNGPSKNEARSSGTNLD